MSEQYGMFGQTTATIAISTTTSNVIDCVRNGPMANLLMPAAFTGTTITFLISNEEGGTYVALHKDGSDVSVAVAASKGVWLDPFIFYGLKYIKIVSGSTEVAARTITVVHRET